MAILARRGYDPHIVCQAVAPIVEHDPVLAAFENAPLDERPVTDEERLALIEARTADGKWLSGVELTAALQERKRLEG